eukprot:jgi/Undpi1/2242/HiC_scaffold_12.g05628.m1
MYDDDMRKGTSTGNAVALQRGQRKAFGRLPRVSRPNDVEMLRAQRRNQPRQRLKTETRQNKLNNTFDRVADIQSRLGATKRPPLERPRRDNSIKIKDWELLNHGRSHVPTTALALKHACDLAANMIVTQIPGSGIVQPRAMRAIALDYTGTDRGHDVAYQAV